MATVNASNQATEIMDRLRKRHGVGRTGIAVKKERVRTPAKKDRKAAKTSPVQAKAKTPKVAKAFPICACGCKEETRGGTYRPGHDSKHKSALAGPKVYPDCKCGCGEKTKGGIFRPGHDSIFYSAQKKAYAEAKGSKTVKPRKAKAAPKTLTAGQAAAA